MCEKLINIPKKDGCVLKSRHIRRINTILISPFLIYMQLLTNTSKLVSESLLDSSIHRQSYRQTFYILNYREITKKSTSKTIPVAARSKGPHTRTVLPSVLTEQLITAQLDRECVGNSVRLCS
jgi:hypothetical protein